MRGWEDMIRMKGSGEICIKQRIEGVSVLADTRTEGTRCSGHSTLRAVLGTSYILEDPCIVVLH